MEYLQYDDAALEFRRDQFTFYRSFYEALRDIEDPVARAGTYDLICEYALNQKEPPMQELAPIQRNTLRLAMPVLTSGRKKSLAGRKHGKAYQEQDGNKPETTQEQTRNQIEIEKEKEIEKEIEIDIEKEGSPPRDCKAPAEQARPAEGGASRPPQKKELSQLFYMFWEQYPKKVGREAARKAFKKVDAPILVLLNAIREQRLSQQWQQEDGKYIPNPAKWLQERRWEDHLEPVRRDAVKAGGKLGSAEWAALQSFMQEA